MRRMSLLSMALAVVIVVWGFSAGATDYPQVDFDTPIDGTWVHKHVGYPKVPNGLAEIKDVFGAHCNSNVNYNQMTWKAADTGTKYNVNFHKKLGGDTSSNLDWDVKGHIKANGLKDKIKSGIGAYDCRHKSTSSTEWSTHAWGIAVDVSWNYENQGDPCQVITKDSGIPAIWKSHGYTWGGNWSGASKDCMHFQYAKGY